MSKRIMFVGPSGIGKTTLAQAVAKKYNISFISGSMSDLLPPTKDISHNEILSLGSEAMYKSDFQLLNLRNKLFKDKENFVTDRSYADLAAYFWYKQSRNMPECEMEHFFCQCKELMENQCDLAIFLPLNLSTYHEWPMEDNNKRIMNRFFQVQISSLMSELLANWEIPTVCVENLDFCTRLNQIWYHIDRIWEKK
ncbi:MAG: deoxynucleoside kinase [Bacteriophage sp.]|nr:MAG: deoxynucleoside kinase [Bacteriophage sp.]